MNTEQIEKVKEILTNWNPLGDRAIEVSDLNNYNTEAIDILCLLSENPTVKQIEKMTRTIMEEAFLLHLNPDEVMPVARQIHEVLKKR